MTLGYSSSMYAFLAGREADILGFKTFIPPEREVLRSL